MAVRVDFHAELDRLIDTVVETGELVAEMLEQAVRSLTSHDTELANEVIRADDRVDAAYADMQNRVVRVMALQAPVASDLRLLAATLHVSIHLERMGDYALNVARTGKLSAELRDEPELTGQLQEMGRLAAEVGRRAVAAFARRDVDGARALPALDDPVDRLNAGVFQRLVRLATVDDRRLEWASRMLVVPRHIERYGDHAIDIGEATIFAVTGKLVEMSSNAPRGEESL